MPYEVEWNPLRDDDQALRLSIKLKMTIVHVPSKENANDEFVNAMVFDREDRLITFFIIVLSGENIQGYQFPVNTLFITNVSQSRYSMYLIYPLNSLFEFPQLLSYKLISYFGI